jgi:hypothetical protein
MPCSEPEPAASPLLIDEVAMPPLVLPTLEVIMERCTTLTSPGSLVFA